VEGMLPATRRVVGDAKVVETPLRMPSEDFSYYAQKVPGMFVFLGATSPDQALSKAAPNHSPYFRIDEDTLKVGANLFVNWALHYHER
jgi:metal-dependent amidase/aminoacylase/carboxypeptidase family protein